MLMTRQEAAAEVVNIQLENEGGYSCLNFIGLYNYAERAKLADEYRAFSNASFATGFIHLCSSEKWFEMSDEEQQSYRLEMLYYFWLSNQEM